MKVLLSVIVAAIIILGISSVTYAKEIRCADYNHDSSVSFDEVLQVADRFGTYVGGPYDWSPQYDLNKDHAINISDIMIAIIQMDNGCS